MYKNAIHTIYNIYENALIQYITQNEITKTRRLLYYNYVPFHFFLIYYD